MHLNSKQKKLALISGGCLLFLLIVGGVALKVRHDLGQEVGYGGYDLLKFTLQRLDR